MFFAIPLVLFPAGLCIKLFTRHKTAGRILLLCGAVPLIITGLFFLFFFMLWNSSSDGITEIQWDILAVSVPAILLTIALHFRRLRRKRVLIPLFLLLTLGGCLSARTLYIQSIPVVSTRDVSGYDPYNKRLDAFQIDEPSSFRFSGKLPRLDGATALYPLYASFYRAAYPREARWVDYIDCSTTAGAYKNIIDGHADIIFVAEASDAQAEAAREKGVELVFTPIGSEAFVFIVNGHNPLESITPDQLRGIYSAQITEWSELGVKGLGSIRAFQRSEGSGSQTAFTRFIARGQTLMEAPTEMVAADMGGMVETVADYRNFRNAIGYSFRYYCTEMLGNNEIRLLSINGISPTPEHIADGTYPFAGYFYAVTRADADEDIRAFIDWMTCPQGQSIVSLVGYTPLAAQ